MSAGTQAMMATTLLLYATLTLAANPSSDGIRWTAEVDEALRLSQKYHVPVLLHFSSDHCPPCRLLDQRAFKTQAVIKAVHDDYIPVLINVDKNRPLAQKYSVEQWPTDILLNSDGEVMHRGVSPQDPKLYQEMLTQGVQSHKSHLALKIEAAKDADPGVLARPKSTLVNSTNSIASKNQPSDQAKSTRSETFTPAAPWSTKFPPNPFNSSTTNSQSSAAHPSSIAAKVNSQPSLHPEAPSLDSAAAQSAPSLQTFNPFFKNSADTSANTSTSAAPSATVAVAEKSTIESKTTSPIAPLSTESTPAATTTSDRPEVTNAENKPTTEESQPPILDGFCPVSLHEALTGGDFANAWQEGDATIAIKHRSCIYWLRDEEQAKKFMANPDQYAATLSGFDLVTFIQEGVLLPGKREFGFVREGRLFLFSSEKNKAQFAANHNAFVSELKEILQQRVAQESTAGGNATR